MQDQDLETQETSGKRPGLRSMVVQPRAGSGLAVFQGLGTNRALQAVDCILFHPSSILDMGLRRSRSGTEVVGS